MLAVEWKAQQICYMVLEAGSKSWGATAKKALSAVVTNLVNGGTTRTSSLPGHRKHVQCLSTTVQIIMSDRIIMVGVHLPMFHSVSSKQHFRSLPQETYVFVNMQRDTLWCRCIIWCFSLVHFLYIFAGTRFFFKHWCSPCGNREDTYHRRWEATSVNTLKSSSLIRLWLL